MGTVEYKCKFCELVLISFDDDSQTNPEGMGDYVIAKCSRCGNRNVLVLNK